MLEIIRKTFSFQRNAIEEHGSAFIELVFALPILLILGIWTFEYAYILDQRQQVSSLGRETAKIAFLRCSRSGGDEAGNEPAIRACLNEISGQMQGVITAMYGGMANPPQISFRISVIGRDQGRANAGGLLDYAVTNAFQTSSSFIDNSIFPLKTVTVGTVTETRIDVDALNANITNKNYEELKKLKNEQGVIVVSEVSIPYASKFPIGNLPSMFNFAGITRFKDVTIY